MRTNEHEFPKDPASLEKEIDETRADVRATLEALEEKLSPGQVLDHAVSLARRHGGSYTESLVRAAKENPLATLMASFGVAWLLTAARPEEEEQARRAAELAQTGEGLQRGLGEPSPGLPVRRDTRAGRIRSGFDQFIYDQPLVVGAIGVAVGAVVGAALRTTNGGRIVEELLEEEADAAAREAAAREAAEEALNAGSGLRSQTDEPDGASRRRPDEGWESAP